MINTLTFPTGSKLGFYKRSKRWERGRRTDQATCEQDSCSPARFASKETREECLMPENQYCEGHDCKFCDYDNYWDYQGKKAAVICTLIDMTDQKPLGETTQGVACTAQA